MYKARLIHAQISLGKFEEFLDNFIYYSKQRISTCVYVANVHMFIECKIDYDFRASFNLADIVLPDGKPLCNALYYLYNIKQERVAGMDVMPALLERASKSGVIVYFYGSTDDVLKKIHEKCASIYPTLKIGGMYSPPFRKLTADEDQKIIDNINASGAGIVLVALGCPKQEKWMSAMKGRISSVMIGVGGAFPVFAGAQKRAPKWMQDASLEWLYRLVQEPRRLFKRYFVTNSLFIFMVLREKLRLSWFPSHK
ncbi:glycosyltransferase [Runella rosea]|uniref:Glycosyltransferase n=1 Tax=Runella rosea TaxID=2259595 RepID=A0A344TEF0_9BACT|nr:WecB/TagA/CpsF family glycosyltransferase [Runella rosea]AXE17021.1 glycosyltransferase [Runella rosea]